MTVRIGTIAAMAALAACGQLEEVGKTPALTQPSGGNEHFAMTAGAVPGQRAVPQNSPSLWTGGRTSLLGDRRAAQRGDIMTVVIEIDESAQINNRSQRGRSGSQSAGVGSLMGLETVIEDILPGDGSLADAVELNSESDFSGSGSIRRAEKLTLRVAATVLEVMPNGALRIEGTQEVRVNNEVRVLLVSGFVRPGDVTRQNEITYDKIASARISYGGRGHITAMQAPRYGQQVADVILPF
ncbi:flagellar basal body L-ring protein FlgH [Jannaschia sp. LMIT008]|uniref:flagellar basal body L-ring protein FlgH n=1 Tax=Jannaschia maritima TaxID=3032585 RepID=UPI002810D746|nr:flagellar basal body L-ring protein FlgH [Jannaschia sp. LMIT008]